MSPLRPTNTSAARSASSRPAISPLGVMLCALATLVTVPLVLASGASSDGDEVAVVVVHDTASASQLEADVDIDELFDAGAKLDDVPEVTAETRGASAAAVVAAVPQRLPDDESQRSDLVTETPASSQGPVTSTTISSAPAAPAPAPSTTEAQSSNTAAPTTEAQPVTTAPPTTAAPTTAAPTTAAPTTAVPVTEAPSTTEAPPETVVPEPVAETPQAAEQAAENVSAAPTAEQWAALRQCEASGSYSIVSRNGLYHGAYQFYQPTWDGLANQLGRSDLVGLPPSQAAPADQDALALLLWQQRGNQPWPHCGVHLPTGP